MIAEHAALYAELVLSLGKGGESIFWNHMPDTDSLIMCFYDCPTWEAAESSALKVDQFGCEVYTRSKSVKEAKKAMWDFHKGIMGFGGTMADSDGQEVQVTYVDVDKNPHSFGQDEKSRAVYSARYRFRVESCGDLHRL